MIDATNETKHQHPRDILLIEDNPADVRLIQEVLKEESIKDNLSNVFDGTDALKYLHGHCKPKNHHCPYLIILDLNLPKMNGFEVLVEIKNNEILYEIPVVVFTTTSLQEDGSKCYAMDADAYFTKPMDFEGFRQVIKQLNKL
ncbi:MAG: response regulator [Methanobacterium sp.]